MNIVLSVTLISVILHHSKGLIDTSVNSRIKRSDDVTSRNHRHNVTFLLDKLLSGYDKNLRPNFGESPVIVDIDFNVRSMGPISEVDMTFSMDCYFRQSWIDRRLELITGHMAETMTLGMSTLEKIWKPDTYFLNGRQSYLHTITVPNRFVRIDRTGRVLYSQRLTIKASCPMDLINFPIDTQRCPLRLGSFAYSATDVVYRWNSLRRVVIAPDMKMSQFDLISSPSNNDSTVTIRNDKYSTLSIQFCLQRHTGYFLIQVYTPCILLVILSWVAFWINREATADRVALGVSTVLTMTFIGLDSRNDLPKVPYSTALDCFIAISFVFVFASILQFAIVHYFTKRGSGEVHVHVLRVSGSDVPASSTMDQHHDDDKDLFVTQSSDDKKESTKYGDVVFLKQVDTEFLRRWQRNARKRQSSKQATMTVTRCISRDEQQLSDEDVDEDVDTRSTCGLRVHSKRKKKTKTTTSIASPLLQMLSCDRRKVDAAKQSTRMSACKDRTTSNLILRPLSKVGRPLPKRRHSNAGLDGINSVSRIDSISRILFPVSFCIVNVVYWYTYLSQTSLSQAD